jgi:biotin synthase
MQMNDKINIIAEYVLNDQLIDRHQANVLIEQSQKSFMDLLFWADKIRQQNFGNKIRVCSIVPGRLGGCSQDCAFCAQSAKSHTEFSSPKYMTDDEIFAAAKEAKQKGVPSFCIVYSGKTINEDELQRLEKLIPRIKNTLNLSVCGGFGILTPVQAKRLKDAGMSRYNHNLETSEKHFGNIVTTHSYADRVSTIKAAKQAGLGICGGGIFGIGEVWDDRLDMAFELRGLGVDMVPLNFLHPIPGTPMGHVKTLKPKEILTITAIYRFILPNADLKVAGGRVLNLRDMQSWIFMAGATAIISGNYLTTAGRSVEEDLQMLADLGLESEKA